MFSLILIVYIFTSAVVFSTSIPSKSPSLKPTSTKSVWVPDPKYSPVKSPACVTPTSAKIPILSPLNAVTIDKVLPKYASSVNGRLTYKFNVKDIASV